MIPYQLVSMAAIMRDFSDPVSYFDDEHEKLADIADYLYNVGDGPERLAPEYKAVYDQYGPDYFAKVIRDMEALDSQLTSAAKEDELSDDYYDRLGLYRMEQYTSNGNGGRLPGDVNSATSVTAGTDLSDEELLQTALDLINEYSREEFDRDEDKYSMDDDLSDLGLMYTTDGGDNEVELQVSADLINNSIKYYVRGIDSEDYDLRYESKYDTLEELIDNELTELDWDDLYGTCVDLTVDSDYDPESSPDYPNH